MSLPSRATAFCLSWPGLREGPWGSVLRCGGCAGSFALARLFVLCCCASGAAGVGCVELGAPGTPPECSRRCVGGSSHSPGAAVAILAPPAGGLASPACPSGRDRPATAKSALRSRSAAWTCLLRRRGGSPFGGAGDGTFVARGAGVTSSSRVVRRSRVGPVWPRSRALLVGSCGVGPALWSSLLSPCPALVAAVVSTPLVESHGQRK